MTKRADKKRPPSVLEMLPFWWQYLLPFFKGKTISFFISGVVEISCKIFFLEQEISSALGGRRKEKKILEMPPKNSLFWAAEKYIWEPPTSKVPALFLPLLRLKCFVSCAEMNLYKTSRGLRYLVRGRFKNKYSYLAQNIVNASAISEELLILFTFTEKIW